MADQILTQTDWSYGVFDDRNGPGNSVYGMSNALINDAGKPFKRGGLAYHSAPNAGETLTGLAAVNIAKGPTTLLWGDAGFYELDGALAPVAVPNVPSAVDPPQAGERLEVMSECVLWQPGGSFVGSVYAWAGSAETANHTAGMIGLTEGSATVTGVGTSFSANVDAGMILRVGAIGDVVGTAVVKSVDSDTQLTLTRPWQWETSKHTATGVAATDLLTSTAHGLAAGDQIQFSSLTGGAGLSTATGYYVIATGLTANEFKLSATPGGSAIDFTTDITAATLVSSVYSLEPIRNVGAPAGGEPVTCKAVVANRLLVGSGNRVYFTRPGILDFQVGDFHEMPSGAQVTGIAGLGPSTAVVFTTAGIFTISGLAFDPIDDAGNIQHEVSHGARDLILWGDQGIAGYAGGLVVPAIDDVYLLGTEPVPISEGIRKTYRAYVEAGHRPGTAAVYRGHYLLPIVDSSDVPVAMLVCRLDRGRAWTNWLGQANGGAVAARVGDGEPALFGLTAQRVTDLTGCWTPEAANKQDPGGVHPFGLQTRAMDLGPGAQRVHVEKVRVRYRLVDAASDNPTMAFSYATTESNGVTVTALRGGGESDGTDYSVWLVNKKAERMHFGLACLLPAAELVIEEIEVFIRTAGVR